jgi:predicted small lipoprotein YifL
MVNSRHLIALLALVSLTQTACGQKGDLYLPDAKPATPAK